MSTEENALWDLMNGVSADATSDYLLDGIDSISDASAEVQLEYYENQLMAYLVTDFEQYRTQMNRLQAEYFRNENYVLYKMLSRVTTERGLLLDLDYLKVYLQSHASEVALDSDRIQFDSYTTDGQTGIEGLILSTVEVFQTYRSGGFIRENSFDDALSRFKTVFTRLGIIDTLQIASTALTHPVYYNRKSYSGVEGTLRLLGQKVNVLKSSLGEEQSYRMVDASDIDFDEEDAHTPTLLAELDFLPTLNESMQGLRTNTMAIFVAPEKGMKSKFATRVSHSVLLNGHNICFWGKEGGSRKVMAELRAIHFDYYYNVQRGQNYEKVSGQSILMGTLEPALKELERFSRMDLVQNPAYGGIFLPDYPFEYENVEMVVREASEDKGCKFVVIDYIQVLNSREINDDRIIIEKTASRLESLKGELDICIWCPAQMSTDAVQAMGNGQHRELRNVTAKSTELTKSADLNIMLYTNDALSKKNVAKLYPLPSRIMGEFEPIDVFTDKVANNVIEMKNQSVEVRNGEVTIIDREDLNV